MSRLVAVAALLAIAIPTPVMAQRDDDVLFARALALVDGVTDRGCSPRLLGSPAHPFHEAPAACDVFLSLAVASMAADHPPRRDQARVAIERLLEHALGPRGRAPFRSSGVVRIDNRRVPRSVLWRGYVLAIASALERVGGAHPFTDPLADSLAADLSGTSWLPSFGRSIWPCDHAPAVAGLLLHAGARSDERAVRWRSAGRALGARLGALLDGEFPTRVDAAGRAIEPLPRGTVLAFTAGFLVHADRPLAARFASTLSRDFCDSVGSRAPSRARAELRGRSVESALPVPGVQPSGEPLRSALGALAACREWPRGVDRPADAVSGTLIEGYGFGASALGMGATRALDDPALHEALIATAERYGIARYRAHPDRFGLENAIELWARTARPL